MSLATTLDCTCLVFLTQFEALPSALIPTCVEICLLHMLHVLQVFVAYNLVPLSQIRPERCSYIHVYFYKCVLSWLKRHSVAISPSPLSTDPAMAEPPAQPTGPYHPEERYDAPTFSIGSQLWMFRGMLKSFQHKSMFTLPREVEMFDGITLSWKKYPTSGELPSWFQGAAVTSYHTNVYFMGGNSGGPGLCNELSVFNSQNFVWRRIVSSGQMLRTMNSGLVALPSGDLLTAGGYAERPTHQPMTGFIPNPGNSKGRGWTNQFLYYNSESGVCIDCQYLYSTSHAVHEVTTGPLHV